VRAVNAHRRSQRTRRTRGQSLVEFALIAPFLLVLIVGGGQIAAILYAGVTVASAAHDAAKVASEQPYHSGAYTASGVPTASNTTCPSATNPVCLTVTQSEGLLSGVATVISPGSAGGTGTNCNAGWVPDGYVTVKVSDDVPIFVPILNNLLANAPGGTVRTISTTVVMRVEPCTITAGQ
jgi:Flp pilus assembly protein TadG